MGVSYMYITANDKEIKWKKSEYSINDYKSIPGLSLQPFYQVSTFKSKLAFFFRKILKINSAYNVYVIRQKGKIYYDAHKYFL